MLEGLFVREVSLGRGLLPQEALCRVGGSRAALDQGVQAKRVIYSVIGGFPMYFFPRRSYARENMFKQKLGGLMDKHTENDGAMADIQGEHAGF